MSGVMCALLGSGSSILPASLAAGDSDGATTVGLGAATGRVAFNSDGSISYVGAASEAGAAGPVQWANSIQAGIGAGIFIKATVTSGALTSNPAVLYTALSSALTFTNGATTGTGTATVTFDFSYDGVNSSLTSPGWTIRYEHVCSPNQPTNLGLSPCKIP